MTRIPQRPHAPPDAVPPPPGAAAPGTPDAAAGADGGGAEPGGAGSGSRGPAGAGSAEPGGAAARADADRHLRRLRRQLAALERRLPVARESLRAVADGRARLVRLPLALVLIVGGVLGFLPVLGFWMIPLGLLLLALDLPLLRPWVAATLLRLRLWTRRRLRRPPSGRP